MQPTAQPPNSARASSSLIRINYRIRVSSFAMGFAVFASHFLDKGATPLLWVLTTLQFLAYPHVLYWRTQKVADPLRAEIQHLRLEPFLFGLWCAVLGLPLWITVGLLNCALVNNIYFRDLRGGVEALATFGAGIALWAALAGGIRIDPSTSWLTTFLAIAALTLYMAMTARAAFTRNTKLRDARERLQHSEHTVHIANLALQKQITQINILQTQLSEQANRDPLTGLYNRRYLDSTLERELVRCKREGQPMSLLLIDIDHFKRINDTYGHQAGDTVIREVAAALSKQARAGDVVCRYGGEEFLMLLPGMPQDTARERAEQWRASLGAAIIRFGEFEIQASMSIGVATYPGHGISAEELIRNADRALYCAKSEGRDRVVVLQPVRQAPEVARS